MIIFPSIGVSCKKELVDENVLGIVNVRLMSAKDVNRY